MNKGQVRKGVKYSKSFLHTCLCCGLSSDAVRTMMQAMNTKLSLDPSCSPDRARAKDSQGRGQGEEGADGGPLKGLISYKAPSGPLKAP